MTSTTRIRKKWMPEEDVLLRCEADAQCAVSPGPKSVVTTNRGKLSTVSQGCLRDWNRIAAKLPGRTNKDCRKRWSKVCETVNKGVWSSKEDEQLREAVEKFGPRWTHVAQSVGTRHADQCAKRWTHSLDPDLDRSQWVADDDARLLEATANYGRNWSVIMEKAFPARSPTDIKNRHVILERKQKQALGPSKLPAKPSSSPSSSSPKSNSTPSEVAPTEMNIDSDPWSKRDLPAYTFDNLDAPDLLGMGPGSDNFSIPTPLSLETAPSPDDFSTSGFQLSDFDDGDHFLDGTHQHALLQLQPAPLLSPTPGSSDLDLLLGSTDFSVAYDAFDSTPDPIDRRSRSAFAAVGPSDLPPAAAAAALSGQRNTLILEDLQPETVNRIMSTLFRSNTKVKMRLYSQD